MNEKSESAVLAAIDELTRQVCASCQRTLLEDGPDETFCSEACQMAWTRDHVRPVALEDEPFVAVTVNETDREAFQYVLDGIFERNSVLYVNVTTRVRELEVALERERVRERLGLEPLRFTLDEAAAPASVREASYEREAQVRRVLEARRRRNVGPTRHQFEKRGRR